MDMVQKVFYIHSQYLSMLSQPICLTLHWRRKCLFWQTVM